MQTAQVVLFAFVLRLSSILEWPMVASFRLGVFARWGTQSPHCSLQEARLDGTNDDGESVVC
jgi:hypothetical protein